MSESTEGKTGKTIEVYFSSYDVDRLDELREFAAELKVGYVQA